MKQRIRAAAIVVRDGRLLLVRHAGAGDAWWSPPGGGVEGGETLLAAAEREVWEETNLRVRAGKIAYVQELLDVRRNRRTIECFVVCDDLGGVLLGEREGPAYAQQARFVSRAELAAERVLPDLFAAGFWDDLAAGLPDARYLGMPVVE